MGVRRGWGAEATVSCLRLPFPRWFFGASILLGGSNPYSVSSPCPSWLQNDASARKPHARGGDVVAADTSAALAGRDAGPFPLGSLDRLFHGRVLLQQIAVSAQAPEYLCRAAFSSTLCGGA